MATKRLTTTLSGESIGSLVVDWECENENIFPADQHPDNPSKQQVGYNTVGTIHSVEFQVFDKVGIDITRKVLKDKRILGILEEQLLDAV